MSKPSDNGFPKPKKVNCFQCQTNFFIKYVVPNKSYSKKTTENTGLILKSNPFLRRINKSVILAYENSTIIKKFTEKLLLI